MHYTSVMIHHRGASLSEQQTDLPIGLSRKFWSAKNFGPGDQNSWKIGPPDHYFLKILVRAWNYGPSENTLV